MSAYNPIVIPFYTSLTLTPLPSGETDANDIIPILENAEQYTGTVFADPGKGYDIGYGNQLNTTNLTWILQAMGVTLTPAQSTSTTNIVSGIDQSKHGSKAQAGVYESQLTQAIGQSFQLSQAQAEVALESIVAKVTIPGLNKLLTQNGLKSLTTTSAGDTQEYAGLLDMFYAGGNKLFGKGILGDLQVGDRADAWFEIRYGSNQTHQTGIAKRRDYDAQLFGLFSTPSAPSADEVVQAYQMLTTHRNAIIQYEAMFGDDPDATYNPGANSQIDAAFGQLHLPVEARHWRDPDENELPSAHTGD